MNKKKLIITIVISGISFVIGYFVNYFLTEYITREVSTEAYGYVSLSKTISSYAMIGSAALNSYASRFIAVAYHQKNYKKANEYFSSVFWGNVVLGLLIGAVWLIVIFFANVWIGEDIKLVKEVTILFAITYMNLFMQLTGTVFQTTALIRDKLLMNAFFRMLSYVFEGICLLLLFITFPARIYFVAIGSIVTTMTALFSNVWMTQKYTRELSISIKYFRHSATKELLTSGIWNSINTLGNTLNSGLDQIVTNGMLGAYSMGQVSIVKTFTNIFSTLFSMVSQPFQPQLLKLYANNQSDELIKCFKLASKVSGGVSNIAIAGVWGFGLCYFELWLPNQNVNLLYYLAVIGIGASIFEGAVYPLYYIYTLTVKNKFPSIVTIIGGCVNVLGMIFLIKYTNLGIYSIFITTFVVMNVINGITNPMYMANCLKVKWYTFYPELGKHLLSLICICICVSEVNKALNVQSWMGLIIGTLISIVIGGLIHITIMFNKNEIAIMLKKIRGAI